MNHYFQIRALASAVEKAKILKSYKQRDTFPQVSVVGCLKKKINHFYYAPGPHRSS